MALSRELMGVFPAVDLLRTRGRAKEASVLTEDEIRARLLHGAQEEVVKIVAAEADDQDETSGGFVSQAHSIRDRSYSFMMRAEDSGFVVEDIKWDVRPGPDGQKPPFQRIRFDDDGNPSYYVQDLSPKASIRDRYKAIGYYDPAFPRAEYIRPTEVGTSLGLADLKMVANDLIEIRIGIEQAHAAPLEEIRTAA